MLRSQDEPLILTEITPQPEQPELLQAEMFTLEATPPLEQPQILAELIIEEVSIDGMCGVY